MKKVKDLDWCQFPQINRFFTEVVLRDVYLCWLISINDEPGAHLNEIGNERRQQTFHNGRVSQQDELIDNSDFEILICNWRII